MKNVFDKNNLFAIVGASNNVEKYGYKVLKDLKEAGYDVVPVNPHEKEILGLKVYSSIEEIPKKIDLVVFIISPKIVLKELEKVKKLRINRVWMQPGSESEEAIEYCKKNGIECMYHACVMVERPKESIK